MGGLLGAAEAHAYGAHREGARVGLAPQSNRRTYVDISEAQNPYKLGSEAVETLLASQVVSATFCPGETQRACSCSHDRTIKARAGGASPTCSLFASMPPFVRPYGARALRDPVFERYVGRGAAGVGLGAGILPQEHRLPQQLQHRDDGPGVGPPVQARPATALPTAKRQLV